VIYNLHFLNNFLLVCWIDVECLQSTWIQQTLPAKQSACQGKCWQRSYSQYISHIALESFMGRVKINFFDVLDKY